MFSHLFAHAVDMQSLSEVRTNKLIEGRVVSLEMLKLITELNQSRGMLKGGGVISTQIR